MFWFCFPFLSPTFSLFLSRRLRFDPWFFWLLYYFGCRSLSRSSIYCYCLVILVFYSLLTSAESFSYSFVVNNQTGKKETGNRKRRKKSATRKWPENELSSLFYSASRVAVLENSFSSSPALASDFFQLIYLTTFFTFFYFAVPQRFICSLSLSLSNTSISQFPIFLFLLVSIPKTNQRITGRMLIIHSQFHSFCLHLVYFFFLLVCQSRPEE